MLLCFFFLFFFSQFEKPFQKRVIDFFKNEFINWNPSTAKIKNESIKHCVSSVFGIENCVIWIYFTRVLFYVLQIKDPVPCKALVSALQIWYPSVLALARWIFELDTRQLIIRRSLYLSWFHEDNFISACLLIQEPAVQQLFQVCLMKQ